MSTDSSPAALDDSSERFSLLELDLPGVPFPAAPVAEGSAPIAPPAPAQAPTMAQAVAAAVVAPVPAAATVTTEQALVTTSTLVAGAAAEGHGVLLGWWGNGETTLAKVAAAVTGAGFDATWLPAARSAHAHAGRAVAKVASSSTRTYAIANEVGCEARYAIAEMTLEGAVGDSIGSRIATVSLRTSDKQLEVAGDQKVGDVIKAEYARLCGAEVLKSQDLTDWLASTLRAKCGAGKVGGNFFVRREHAESAKKLVKAVKSLGWGKEWLTGLPCATSEELRAGLVDGIALELDNVVADFDKARAEAKAEGRADVGPRAASNAQTKLKSIAERGLAFATVLGREMMEPFRVKVQAALAVVEPLISIEAERFSALFDELALEEARKAARS